MNTLVRGEEARCAHGGVCLHSDSSGSFALVVVAALPAGAAKKSSPKVPGMLRSQDLTGGLRSGTSVGSTFMSSVVDPAACTEAPQPINAVKTLLGAQYAPAGAPVGTLSLGEAVVTFSDTRAAKAAFAVLATSVAAAIACPSVGLPLQGATTPAVTFKFAHVDFPKIGSTSYAITLGVPGGTSVPSTQVVFLSGANIAVLAGVGASAPSLADLKMIAMHANKRLVVATPVPTTTSTTAPKPLTVDPVASHCADEGKVVSPSASQVATIMFSNQTSQTLKIYWLDYTGVRKPYGEVAPGVTATQSTFVGHYWLLADATDHCARIASVDGPTLTMTCHRLTADRPRQSDQLSTKPS